MKQADRSSKQTSTAATGSKGEPSMKNTPPNDELQFYNITTKIGYVSGEVIKKKKYVDINGSVIRYVSI